MKKVLLTSGLIASLAFGYAAETFSYDFPTEIADKGKKGKKKKKSCCKSKSGCCKAKEGTKESTEESKDK